MQQLILSQISSVLPIASSQHSQKVDLVYLDYLYKIGTKILMK